MTTLEKILQDIDNLKKLYSENAFAFMDKGNLPCEYDSSDIESAKVKAISEVMEIIKKHLFDNEGWIPVEEGMPETNKKVDITFREWMKYSKKYRYGTCNAVYIPKNTVKAENMWSDYENSDCVDYDEDTDTEYALPGWYETIEHWDDYSHCYINCEVIAWQPLPEPYRKDGE